jgi:hypothetical protein
VVNYDALSYVWGSQTEGLKFLSCNGHQCQITNNLHAALDAIWSANPDLKIWADAICINQADGAEKGAQVARMHHIYSRASCVRVWLGEADEDVINMLPCLPQYDRLEDTRYEDNTAYEDWRCDCLSHTGPTAEPKEICLHRLPKCLARGDPRIQIWSSVLSGLNNLLSRDWFGRAWTMQEAILARQAMMHFGTYSMDWVDFRRRCSISDGSGLQIRNYLVQEVFAAQETMSEQKYGMSQLLVLAWPREAHDPRDKVFSLFGLLSKQPFKVNYSRSLREIYIAATRACITTEKTLRVLNAAGLTGTPQETYENLQDSQCKWFERCSHADGHCNPGGAGIYAHAQEFPSWVTDWRATSCNEALAPTSWYMTVRDIDSAHVCRALLQDTEDLCGCLMVIGVVLGRFSGHASFRKYQMYANDGITKIGWITSEGAVTEFPPCTSSCFDQHVDTNPADSVVSHGARIGQLSSLLRRHDLQQCECSYELRQKPLKAISSLSGKGKLPRFCTDGDWVCILDGASAPSILRPERSVATESDCRYPKAPAFVFVGNMKSSFQDGYSQYKTLLGVRSDPLVTWTGDFGEGEEVLTSERRHKEDIGWREEKMQSNPNRWNQNAREKVERMKQWRRVRLAEGVFHLH